MSSKPLRRESARSCASKSELTLKQEAESEAIAKLLAEVEAARRDLSRWTPDLTQNEIASICHPLVQGAAQVRYLRSLGLKVDRRPDGKPLVNRAHYDAIRGGDRCVTAAGDEEPNWSVPA